MNDEKNTMLIPNETDEQELTLMDDSFPEVSSDILFEDTSKRSENVKHFRMRNGHYMAAVYDKPVHTKDKTTGKFVDIAHRFDEKDDCFEAETDRFKARFPKKEGKRKFVTVEKDGRSVSWRYIPVSKSHKKNAEAAIHQHHRKSLMELPRFPQLKYEKTDNQIDLEYGITEQGVKENIILTKRPKHSTFRFELKLDGLKAILAEDKKSIQLFANDMESNEPEFVIPPINMSDATGVYSEAAHYELVENDNGTVMEIVIDPQWLFADERLYPVTVDPQLTVSNKETIPASQFNSGFTLSEANGILDEGRAYVAGYDNDGKEMRIYLKYAYPELPKGYNITSAKLNVHQQSYLGETTYTLHEIQSSWSKSTLTWNNQPSFGSALANIVSMERSSSETIELDITRDVRSYYRNQRDNYGFMIKSNSCSDNGCLGETKHWGVHTLNGGNSTAPMVVINYTLVDEYADHQKYESFEVGRAGTGSVNLFTGKLFYTHNDVTALGGKLPLALSHVYRSDFAEIAERDTTYGRGWTLSAAQTLELSNSNSIKAIYRDAQGRKHYFKQEENEFHDTAGLQLTFNGSNTIVDEKGNIMTFTNGKLTKITDHNNNCMTYEYDTSNRLKKITDSIGRTATLNYNSAGKLSYIADAKGRTISYTYSGNDLTKITYPDGKVTEFSYSNVTLLLTKVTDQSGISYEITYTDKQVTSLARKGSRTIANNSSTSASTKDGGGVNIIYRNASTAVEDEWTKIRMVYCFDGAGRTLSSYEDLTHKITPIESDITLTDFSEYQEVLNHKTGSPTDGRYASVKASITGTSVMHPNYLANGDFTDENIEWSIAGPGTVSTEMSACSGNSYNFNGDAPSRMLWQTVTINASSVKGNVLVASAWAKASIPTGLFKLYAKLTHTDGTVVEREALFDKGCTDWQYVAVPLAISEGKVPKNVLIRFYNTGCGDCYVSNLRLTETRGTITFEEHNTALYDDSSTTNGTGIFKPGKVLDKDIVYLKRVVTNDGINKTETFYSIESDAVKTITYNAEGNAFTSYARYYDNHQLFKSMDYRGTVDTYAYDSFGNVTQHKTYHKDNSNKFLYTRASYDSTTGRQTYAYDSRINGVGTSYSYDNQSDLLTKRIDPNGQVFQYAYHAQNDQPTAVTAIDVRCASGDIANNFVYTAGYLTQVAHNGYNFNYEYEQLGRNSKIKAGGNNLASFTYTDGEESRIKTTYANGFVSRVYFDSRGNPVKKSIDDTTVSTATYDEQGNVKKLVDKLSNVCYTYTYNQEGELIKVKLTNASSGSTLGTQEYEYENHRLVDSYDSRTGFHYVPRYEKEGSQHYPDNATKGIKLDGKYTDEIERDGLRRPETRKLTLASASTPLMTDTYGYLVGYDNSTTNFVNSLTHAVGGISTTYNYTYDNAGNIETVKRGSVKLVQYTYDGLNRLIQEDNYEFGKRYTYTYDNGGNITSKKEYTLTSSGSVTGSATTYSYTYDTTWKDKLTSFNGQTCAYDALGNPTTYRGNALTWSHVRRLKKYGTNTFEYGADGIRTKKNSITYTLDGNKILKETDGTKTITYYYGNGGVIGFKYNNVDYYYEKNLQGDVIAIYNASGTKVASYVYDAWGKVLSIKNASGTTITDSTHVGNINPFRYRSYYYDAETGLYYLQTRYYDPEVGRFINSDALKYLGDGAELSNYNLFAYCDNNPVMNSDSNGCLAKWLETLATAVSAVVLVAAVVATVTTVTAFTAGTGTAAAVYGSTVFLGAALSGINGGVANASNGDSYLNGYVGGLVSGTIQGFCSRLPLGTIWGGAIGTGAGTAITGIMNNADSYSQTKSAKQIGKDSLKALGKGAVTSCLTATIGTMAGGIDYKTGKLVGGVADQCGGLMPELTLGFAEAIKAFFSAIDDAMTYPEWGVIR